MATSRIVLLVTGFAVLMLAGCGQPKSEMNNVAANETMTTNNIPESDATADGNISTSAPNERPDWGNLADTAAPTGPTKKYASKEGDKYYYVSEVSENDKKDGKATGDVLIYRYLGVIDGKYTIERVEEDGTVAQIATCRKPCAIIKMIDSIGRQLDSLPYNEDSVIGSAFADSFNGFLKRSTHGPSIPNDANASTTQQ